MIKKLLILFIIFVFFPACASHKHLSPEDRSSIKRVSINEKIEMPNDIYYLGPGEFSYIGGALDYLLAQAIYSAVVDVPEDLKGKPKEAFKLIMSKNNIYLNEILFTSFKKKLKNSNLFIIKEKEDTNNIFKLNITIYGLANTHGLSSNLKPMLGVKARLLSGTGKIIWEKYEQVTNLSRETPTYTAENLIRNPELLREAFTSAADVISERFVNDIR
ncbi:MAG: hypothetical protein R6U13_14800 [Desulfatiglandaceae bacterium]